jgi:predicted CopG family antitoxin
MRKKIFTRQLAVSVSEDIWVRILESTDREEVSFSSWIRDAIERKLALDESSQKP